jgi:hypothetical protein
MDKDFDLPYMDEDPDTLGEPVDDEAQAARHVKLLDERAFQRQLGGLPASVSTNT